LFVPTTSSKVAELDSQSFFGEILPPCGCGDFPETPWGLKLCHSNLRFTFVVGTIKHQATGRQKRCVRETDSHMQATPVPSLRGSEPDKWDDGGCSLAANKRIGCWDWNS